MSEGAARLTSRAFALGCGASDTVRVGPSCPAPSTTTNMHLALRDADDIMQDVMRKVDLNGDGAIEYSGQ